MDKRSLHPALLVHTAWPDGRRRLVVQASAAQRPLVLRSPLALSALAALPDRFDRETAGDAWREASIPEPAHQQLWDGFESAGLFVKVSREETAWWDELGWQEARTYHEATRDYPFLDLDEGGALAQDAERMEEYRRESAPPPIYQGVGEKGSVELRGLNGDGSADRWLQEMSDTDLLGRDGLALLLDVCFGERGKIKVAGRGECLLKSIPSGGARHPTEVFLAVFDVEDIPAGIYHYDVQHHRLELVREGQHREAFGRATLDLFSKHDAVPSALLVFTSRVERAMWRYRDPRSFRAILVDVGHAVMAYRYVARQLGFRTYAVQKMQDRVVADLIGVDPVLQPPLYIGTLVR